MKRKDILLIGINFFPEPTGIGKYSGELVEWLSNEGFEIEVISGFPYYPYWKLTNGYSWYKLEIAFDKKVRVHRCPMFVPKRPNGLKRILHELSFFIFALPKVISIAIKTKPRYILCIAPPFHLGLLGYIAKLLSGGKMLYHIQDLQIEAAKSLSMIKQKWLIHFLLKIEKFILAQSDNISSIHPNMIEVIRHKTNKKIDFLPNWSNLKSLSPMDAKSKLRERYYLPNDKKIFLYSGSVGEKQGIEMIFNIAKYLNHEDKYLFIIAGDGPFYNQLKETIIKENLKNIIARNLVPTDELNLWLNLADYHLIFQRNETSNYLFPSKLVSILSVGGICIAFVPEENQIGQLLLRNKIGHVIAEIDSRIIGQKLLDITVEDGTEKKALARKYAIENFSKDDILKGWVQNVLLTKK